MIELELGPIEGIDRSKVLVVGRFNCCRAATASCGRLMRYFASPTVLYWDKPLTVPTHVMFACLSPFSAWRI